MRAAWAWLALLALAIPSANAQFAPGDSLKRHLAGKMFLLGPGARADALGGAGALLGEAYSGLYNPAAQVLMSDAAAVIYYSPQPYFVNAGDFLTLGAAAHSEFGYVSASYLTRQAVGESPEEEATSLLLAGRATSKLAFGLGMKILITRSGFVPLNQSSDQTYKMAFDLGLVLSGFLPQATFGPGDPEEGGYRERFGRPFPPGLVLGAAFLNLGGRVEYPEALDSEMLPQTFRADLLWGAWNGGWMDLRLVGELEKLLIERTPEGGFKDATDAFFNSWGGGGLEGGWTSRLGVELSAFSLGSLRLGWSVDYGDHRAYQHAGLGLGPEWLRANVAFVNEPGPQFTWGDGFRLDLAANLTYDQIRRWTGQE
ncbi:MAG: hypothetical protein C4524_08820 [Candidatus Zixiibacteriota bacterium]|nr:MAG: hypothetical protein C4524_08820 [candidate division Zixibacteria bacterium]